MHDLVNHLIAYAIVAVALAVIGGCYVMFLLRRYAATKYTIRHPGK